MTTPPSSATELGGTFVAALAEKDFDRLADTLAPDVRMRALIPPGLADVSGATAAAARFASWFGELDRLELVRWGADEVGDRLHVCYRLRTKRIGDQWKIIEQHLFCALDEGRISTLDLACSGFRPEIDSLGPHRRRKSNPSLARQFSIRRPAATGPAPAIQASRPNP